MNIIKDLSGKEHKLNGCLSCEINNGKLTPIGGLLYRDEYFSVMQDFELPINGFMIIASIRHIETFAELTEDERVSLSHLINKILNILRNNNIAKEFNIILAEELGDHLHIWLLPQHMWMLEKFGKAHKHIKSIQEYAIANLSTNENIAEIIKTCNIVKNELNKN